MNVKKMVNIFLELALFCKNANALEFLKCELFGFLSNLIIKVSR